MTRVSTSACLKVCLTRVHEVSLSKVLFGDEPWLVLLAVVVGGFVFYPLVRDFWPWLLLALAVAVFFHAWHWCCQEAQAERAESEGEDAS